MVICVENNIIFRKRQCTVENDNKHLKRQDETKRQKRIYVFPNLVIII